MVITDGRRKAGKEELDGIPEVTEDSVFGGGCHFATLCRVDGTFPPCPLVRLAPPLFQVQVIFVVDTAAT